MCSPPETTAERVPEPARSLLKMCIPWTPPQILNQNFWGGLHTFLDLTSSQHFCHLRSPKFESSRHGWSLRAHFALTAFGSVS